MTDTPRVSHPYDDRIADLEARVKSLEAWIDLLRQMGIAPSPPRGCVCPVGAERSCHAAMCPRRPWVVT